MYVYSAGREVNAQVIRENNKTKRKIRQAAKEIYPRGITVPTIEEVFHRRAEAFGEPDFSDIPKEHYLSAEKRAEIAAIQEIEEKKTEAAMKKFVLPVEEGDDDYDYEFGLSRRYSNG